METSHESTGETLFDLTSYAAVIHANPSRLRENGTENTIHDTCGHSYETPLADYDPSTQSWRMFGDTFLSGESLLLETLPPSGMTQNGVLYPQPLWVPLTAETDSSLWPTPRASISKDRYWRNRASGYRSNLGEIRPGEEHLIGQIINPHWLEWLMGFPTGWTELEP